MCFFYFNIYKKDKYKANNTIYPARKRVCNITAPLKLILGAAISEGLCNITAPLKLILGAAISDRLCDIAVPLSTAISDKLCNRVKLKHSFTARLWVQVLPSLRPFKRLDELQSMISTSTVYGP